MLRRRIALGGIAAATIAAAGLFGGLGAGSESLGPAAPVRPDVAAAQVVGGFATGDTARSVEELERRVEAKPDDARLLTLLGLSYHQLSRETGDLAYYERTERTLERALALEPRDHLAMTGLAALAASRHRFDEARVLARRAVRLAPGSAAPYGILGDALLETGRYREAFAAFDHMAALKPSAASYARVSYGREILGDTVGARAAMVLAAEAAEPAGQAVAWAVTNLGNVELNVGRVDAAARHFRRALARVPGYAPAFAGLARIATYRDRPAAAVRLYSEALTATPLPEYAASLGDVLAVLGRRADAEAAWARSDELEREFARHGGRNELETALFDLDHDRDVRGALERARAGWKRRPSVEGEHVLAWALYKNGRCAEARVHSVRALRLGTKDIGALMHRSLIERCLGNAAEAAAFRARALALNPYAEYEVGSPRQGAGGGRS